MSDLTTTNVRDNDLRETGRTGTKVFTTHMSEEEETKTAIMKGDKKVRKSCHTFGVGLKTSAAITVIASRETTREQEKRNLKQGSKIVGKEAKGRGGNELRKQG